MNEKIIFFDGVCHLCNTFVGFILKIDRKHIFKFAPIQGVTGKKLLTPNERDSLETIIFLDQGKRIHKSSAVLNIFKYLGAPYYAFYIFSIIPPILRDFLYDMIARSRYSIFGKSDTCRIPTQEEKKYFLD